jgi:radical SAM protein with 4Fe4S-binding SPASM domain
MHGNFSTESLEKFLFLSHHLGCEFRVNTLKPVSPDLMQAMPTAEQYYSGFAYLLRNTKCVTLGESCIGAVAGTGSQGCPCGTSSFRINGKTADGQISINPCVYMHEFMVGDLLKESLRSIISSPEFAAFASRKVQMPAACKTANCRYLGQCRGGCAARTFFVKGTLDAADPYCPLEYEKKNGPLNLADSVQWESNIGLRVHYDYLCTWIGKTVPSFRSSSLSSIESLRSAPRQKEMSLAGTTQGAHSSPRRIDLKSVVPIVPIRGRAE